MNEALEVLKKAMRKSQMCAWSWHASIVQAVRDEGLDQPEANRIASRVMKALFGVEVKEPMLAPELEAYLQEMETLKEKLVEKMKLMVSLVLTSLLCVSPALAFDQLLVPQGTTIHSQLFDPYPNDGVVDDGSIDNPYILETPNGQLYKMRPRIPDMVPHDGVLDAGSLMNPWVVEGE